MPRTPALRRRRRWRVDLGKVVARVLCALFALIGSLPLGGGFLARTEPVRRWAADETARVLRELLGVQASYSVELSFWPLELALTDVRLESSDGGSPAFEADRLAVIPRVFSLLAGRLDVGDIEVDAPRGRIVIVDGELANVAVKLPKSKGPAPKIERAPFSSIFITDARVDLSIDDVLVHSGPVDLDVFAESGPAFEVALRAGESHVTTRRIVEVEPPEPDASLKGGPADDPPKPAEPKTTVAIDEDVLCQLDLRVRIERDGGLVRRLSLLGAMDDQDAPGTRPPCDASDSDARRVALRLSQVRARLDDDWRPLLLDGHVVAKAPMAPTARFGIGPFSGWTAVAGDARYDAKTKLPTFRGRVRGAGLKLGPYVLSENFDGDIEIRDDVVFVPHMLAQYGHGTADITNVRLAPFEDGLPLTVEKVDGTGVHWEDFMENIDVTPNTIVQWNIDRTVVSSFGGTLNPVALEGDLFADTTGFEVFDRAYHQKDRRHIIGVKAATIRGRFGVRPDAVVFMNTHSKFGSSSVNASVSVGFDNTIWLDVGKESTVELSDISPLVDIPMSGRTTISAKMAGLAKRAELSGELSVKDLVFGGFPIGDVETSKIRFKPLFVDFTDTVGRKGTSTFKVPSAHLDFDDDAILIADAQVESESMSFEDFFHMWHFDEDPRFDEIRGSGKVRARVHYDMGGKKDKCGTGYLRVDGTMASAGMDVFGEHYDTGAGSFDFRWFDSEAGHLGMQVDVPDLMMTKGAGTLLGNVRVTEGGVVEGHVVGTRLPVSKLQAMGELGRRVDARVSAVGDVGGTLDAMTMRARVDVSPTRMGRQTLPASRLDVKLVPEPRPVAAIGKTKCGRIKTAPFDRAEYDKDLSSGVFHTSGQLFGGQIRLDDVTVTRQRSKTVRGRIDLSDLDLGAIAELSPEIALSDIQPTGKVDATIRVDSLPLDHPGSSRVTAVLKRLELARDTMRVRLAQPATLEIRNKRAALQNVVLAATVPGGQQGIFDVRAQVTKLDRVPVVDAELALRPMSLSAFQALVPRADRISGTLRAGVKVTGPVTDLVQTGRIELDDGSILLRGAPVAIEDIQVTLDVTPDALILSEARASVGSGTISATGRAPMRNLELGAARASIKARNVDVPLGPGVETTIDADLVASYRPDTTEGPASLPHISGNVSLRSFMYTRPVTVTADITNLAKRGSRTQFDSYDPDSDVIDLDVRIESAEALRIENDLVEGTVIIEKPGLQLTGTNQRFGLRGQVAVVKGGVIRLRRSEFEITHGRIRFDDPDHIAPKVDVTAVTNYTRYADAQTATGDGTTSGSSAGGRWRITMHAHGDADNLRVDLSSEPELGQDDIFLLLTLGLTRAELDQAQSASAGQSVALEALGRLTGADRAVTETIPVIDDMRFGSAYSSRTGRTQPTVTIGKRLTKRIRAYVTSGLGESREVRSNLEWRLSPRVSVESSYDNINDISSSALGNLGANIRWRLEFE